MTNFITTALIAAIATTAIAGTADAGKRKMGKVMDAYNGPLPPEGFQGRRWAHPSNGCDYSLAGRPGERVWYLISNTSRGKDCVRYFVEQAMPNDISVTRGTYRYK